MAFSQSEPAAWKAQATPDVRHRPPLHAGCVTKRPTAAWASPLKCARNSRNKSSYLGRTHLPWSRHRMPFPSAPIPTWFYAENRAIVTLIHARFHHARRRPPRWLANNNPKPDDVSN